MRLKYRFPAFLGLVLLALIPRCAFPATFLASWYGKAHAGHKTASGKLFNPDELTAASWLYPLGTRLRVTNIHNGHSVIVQVTDRGPGIRTRGLDVSEHAAQLLGFINAGVTRVRVEALP